MMKGFHHPKGANRRFFEDWHNLYKRSAQIRSPMFWSRQIAIRRPLYSITGSFCKRAV